MRDRMILRREPSRPVRSNVIGAAGRPRPERPTRMNESFKIDESAG